MSDRDRTENNINEDSGEEKLFRAMSGVDEELLLRSEQSGSGKTGKVYKFPMRYVSRIAAACLCFAVAGVLYAAMSSTKMADSTGSADTAAPQLAYNITADTAIPEENEAQAEQYAAAQAEDAGNDGMSDVDTSGAAMSEDMAGTGSESVLEEAAAELPESAMEEAKPEAASELPEGAVKEAASELPESAQESAKSEAADNEMPVTQQDSGAQEKQDSQMSTENAVSGGTDEMSETDTTAAAQEGKIMKKQGRHFPGKLTKKGQQ